MTLARPSLVLALILGAGRSAHAEEPAPPDAPVQLDPVVVRIPAASLRSPAAKAPGATVTTIPAERYAGEAKTTAQLLATAPGVAVAEHGGPGQLSLLSIRGSSAQQVKVLLDGLPLNNAAGGGVDLSTIPHQWISRIEVVRGTEGVHHGSGALGGVVNVVTTPATAGKWGASATAGSFGTYEGDGHFGMGGDRWGVLGAVSGSTTRGDFPYRNTALDRGGTVQNAAASQAGTLWKGYGLVAGGRVDVAAQASGGRRHLPGPVGTPTLHDWQEEARGLASVAFRRPVGGGATVSLGGWGRADRLEVSLEELGDGAPTLQRGQAGAATAGVAWAGERGGVAASLEAGGERLEADGTGDRSRPVLAAVLSGDLVTLAGHLRIGPGVRVERAGTFSGVSAKLGATAELVGPLSLRAGAGRTYRIPSFGELYLQQGVVAPNPDLRPEIGWGTDAALVASGWAGSASVGGFATLYDDLVVYVAPTFRRLTPQNIGRSAARGFEAEGALSPIRKLAGLSGGLAYTYLVTDTLRGLPTEVGKDLPLMPRHRLYARLGLGGDPAECHGEFQWISRRYRDLANQAAIDGSSTFGAGGSIRLLRAPEVHLNLEVRNLLDDRTLEDDYMNPLPGRTVLVTLRAGAAEGSR